MHLRREYDIRLLVFERDVHGQNKRVLDALGHVRVARAVVHDDAADEPRVNVLHVLHLHDLNHVQVDRFALPVYWVRARVMSLSKRARPYDGAMWG